MALPTPSTPGYASFRGFTCCDCLAAWLPVYEALAWFRGLITDSIDIWQLTGGAADSAGTHSQGGAFDIFQTTNAHVALAREMGAPASWRRSIAQGFTKTHTHGVLTGCPHNSPARYQITAQRRGYNGLGVGPAGSPYAGMAGYGGKDYHPDPLVYRTWSQGVAWANARIQEAMMDINLPSSEVAKIRDAVWADRMPNPQDPSKIFPAESWLVNANIKAGVAASQADEIAAIVKTTNALAVSSAAQTQAIAELTAKVDALGKAPGV